MWQPIESSMINAVRYDEGNYQLDVEFNNGKCFRYDYVTPGIYSQIMTASSVGKEFHKLVRSQPATHPFVSITKQ